MPPGQRQHLVVFAGPFNRSDRCTEHAAADLLSGVEQLCEIRLVRIRNEAQAEFVLEIGREDPRGPCTLNLFERRHLVYSCHLQHHAHSTRQLSDVIAELAAIFTIAAEMYAADTSGHQNTFDRSGSD